MCPPKSAVANVPAAAQQFPPPPMAPPAKRWLTFTAGYATGFATAWLMVALFGCAADAPPTPNCAALPACHLQGLCHSQAGTCVALTRQDCGPAVACIGAGLCSAAGGRCLNDNDWDCQQSTVCSSQGMCYHDAATHWCGQKPGQ